ncbi:uncharacterized protein TNCV_2291601 [Trichonephila clavipes]|uniref:Uncharacterized protein n=1 Tax=Trichonephila clavipes TaxID=2585209 RepID=A0A8X6V617_TRICX|nr:uncharacterized protein TNCV_2291601 [Trichonephila clavipes]
MTLSVKQFLTGKNITVFEHTRYSPDLAPCDFFHFRHLNLAYREPLLPHLKKFRQNWKISWTSKSLVPELLPVTAAPNVELCEYSRELFCSRPAASLLVRLVEEEARWEESDHPQGVLTIIWGGTEPNHTVTCMVLKATANDRHHLALSHDEFLGPQSVAFADQVALVTTTTMFGS